jgi:hypothetical protein
MDVFDIKNCIRFEDKTYFWDTRTKCIVELEMRGVDIDRCPKHVIEALLAAANRSEGRRGVEGCPI